MLKPRKLMIMAALSCLAVMLAFPAQAAKTYTLKCFFTYGPTESPSCLEWQRLAKEVERKTDGRLQIKIFWLGQHPYEGPDMLKVVSDGAADMGIFYSPFFSGAEPVFGVDTLPMLFPAEPELSAKVLDVLWGGCRGNRDGIIERILQDRWNATIIHRVAHPPQRLFTKGFPVNAMDALKGKKIRANSPETSEFIKIMGGTPVPIKWGEIYTALQQGLLDGYHTSTFYAKSSGFTEHSDTITMVDYVTGPEGLMVNMKSLQKLPEDIREIFLSTYRDDFETNWTSVYKAARTFEQLVFEGQKVYTISKEMREELRKASFERIVKPWLKRTGKEGQEALDTVQRITAQK